MLGTDIEIYEGDIQHLTCAFFSSIRNNIVQLQQRLLFRYGSRRYKNILVLSEILLTNIGAI